MNVFAFFHQIENIFVFKQDILKSGHALIFFDVSYIIIRKISNE